LWNWFGTLDLFAAVALGVTSANGSPLQLIHAGAGSEAIQSLPWSLVPTVLVPFYLIMHGIIFAQLRTRSAQRAGNPLARTA
jgi:cytochrome bd-type quinol oxidase subunit 2